MSRHLHCGFALGLLLGLSGCAGLNLPSFSVPAAPVAEPAAGVEPATAAVARVRASLLTLRSRQDLAARVPDELAEAEALLKKADASQHDRINGPHRIYVAERRAEQVQALAELRALEAEYAVLRQQRDTLRGTPPPR